MKLTFLLLVLFSLGSQSFARGFNKLVLSGRAPSNTIISGTALFHTTRSSCKVFNILAGTFIPRQKNVHFVAQQDSSGHYELIFDFSSNEGGLCKWALQEGMNYLTIDIEKRDHSPLTSLWIASGRDMGTHLSQVSGVSCAPMASYFHCIVPGSNDPSGLLFLDTERANLDFNFLTENGISPLK